MIARLLPLLLVLTACTGGGASTPALGSGPSPAPAFFDPCPTAGGAEVADGLPDVTLHCLGSGPSVRLSALRGPLLVNVWGSWCLPCQEEVPVLQAFYRKAAGRVGLVGIDYHDSRGSAQDFAGHIGMTYPSVVDDEQGIVGRGPFVFKGLPMTVFVDASGKVVDVEHRPFRKLSDLEAVVARQLGVTL